MATEQQVENAPSKTEEELEADREYYEAKALWRRAHRSS